MIYDDWYLAYERYQKQRASNWKAPNYFQSQRICAIYDHYRSNEIYMLMKPQRDMEAAFASKDASH